MEIKTFFGPLLIAGAQANEYLGRAEFDVNAAGDAAHLHGCIAVAWTSEARTHYAHSVQAVMLPEGEELDDLAMQQVLSAEVEAEVRKLLAELG